MKLYKEYKQEQDALAKMKKDKEKMHVSSETIIVYEKTGVVSLLYKTIKNVALLILFIIVFSIITLGITAVVMWIKGV